MHCSIPVYAKEEVKQEVKEEIQSGMYTIALGNKVLEPVNEQLSLSFMNGMDNQKWILKKGKEGKYAIVAPAFDKSLRVAEDGIHITFEENKGKEDLVWNIEGVEDGYILQLDQYLRIDGYGVYFMEQKEQSTIFQIEKVRSLLTKKNAQREASVTVSEEVAEDGILKVSISDITSNGIVGGAKVTVSSGKNKISQMARQDTLGNIELEFPVEEIAQKDKLSIFVQLIVDGYAKVSLGKYSCSILRDLDSLKKKVNDFIETNKFPSSNWQVVYIDLENGQEFEINSHKAQSASDIKLFVMGTTYDQYDRLCKKYSKEAVDFYLEKMITVSDNDAWVNLYTYLGNENLEKGFKKVSKWANENGYTDVETKPKEAYNFTSTKDCTQFIEDLYREKYKHSKDMIKLLLKQEIDHKIPAGLPKGVKVGNKTGELEETENDCAIVYGKSGDYSLCIMSDHVLDSVKAQKNIVGISKLIYTYLNE